MNVAIIIPAYNEKDNILKLAADISKRFSNIQILIIDDSLEDYISSKIKDLQNIKHLFRGRKLGRGSAVLEGLEYMIRNSNIDVFVEMDADYSHDPSEIEKNLILHKKKIMICLFQVDT